jgi:hypothetical protein
MRCSVNRSKIGSPPLCEFSHTGRGRARHSWSCQGDPRPPQQQTRRRTMTKLNVTRTLAGAATAALTIAASGNALAHGYVGGGVGGNTAHTKVVAPTKTVTTTKTEKVVDIDRDGRRGRFCLVRRRRCRRRAGTGLPWPGARLPGSRLLTRSACHATRHPRTGRSAFPDDAALKGAAATLALTGPASARARRCKARRRQ